MMRFRTRPEHGRRVLPALLVGLAVLASVCAGSTASATVRRAASPLGEKQAATGQPITLGYVYDGVSDNLDSSAELKAAQAAVKYVNNYLGGIGGRPIALNVCETKNTPAGAANCVTKMATAKVPVAISGVTSVPGALYPPLAEAGIPVFASGGLEQKSLSDDGIYLMGNAILAVLAGPAQVAKDAGIDQVAILVVDNPAASGQLQQAAPLFYGNVKVGVDVVPIPIDAPDVSPQITAELSKDPGLVQVIGDAPFCGKVMRALDSAGYKGKIVIIPTCIDAGNKADLPGLKGSIMLSDSSTDAKMPEVKLYNAVMDKYAKGAEKGSRAEPGYQSVVGFARVMAGLQGALTAESVKSTIAAMPPTPYPIADGLTFQCNKTQVSIAPNICSNSALQTTLDAKGKGTKYTVLDGSTVLKIG